LSWAQPPRLEHDPIELNRIGGLDFPLQHDLVRSRLPPFGIML
jgi:hypothetical protein